MKNTSLKHMMLLLAVSYLQFTFHRAISEHGVVTPIVSMKHSRDLASDYCTADSDARPLCYRWKPDDL